MNQSEHNSNAIPPECGPTLERIQSVLDRIHPATILAADPHPALCPACRERVRAANLLLSTFAEPQAVAVPSGLTNAILAGVQRDLRSRSRRRAFAFVGGFAAAAAFAIAVWFNQPKANEFVKQEPVPTPIPNVPSPAPPMRVNEELAKAGDAILESSRTITEPASSAPKVFAALTDRLFNTPAGAGAIDFGPASRSLSEIPDAARAGLEPVTGTAQKAFNRLLRDVSAMQPKTKS